MIKNTITFDALKDLIASKLNLHPNHLLLQYRLVFANKPGTNPMDITDEDELSMFESKMRRLVVPQRTVSGKLSNRILPYVTVIFEHQGMEADPPPGRSSGNIKKVSNSLILPFIHYNSKQSANDRNKVTLATTDDEHKAIVQELGMLYRCSVHSKKEGVECFCYPEPTNDHVHQALTYSDLGFWAAQIVSIKFLLSTLNMLMQLLLETKSTKGR
jgi:hypothetical protein